ncbi:hypothetical protein EDC04DRAFT_3137463 [Pisolithus marmoratus]|nr:hypothetical protein EDC04DRAFT_3137463 [Pisolithus marmoratus]
MKLVTFTLLAFTSLISARPSLMRRSGLYHSYVDTTGGPNNGTNGTTSTTATPASSTIPVNSTSPSGGNTTDSQVSLTLIQSVLVSAFANNGTTGNGSEPGITPSLTSQNNFINWCSTVNLTLSNGTQMPSGFCNPAPMGAIPSTSNIPSAKFATPGNLAVIPANTTFQVALAVKGLETGFFSNADTNYLAAPQQLNMSTGKIMGHSHIVIEQLDNLTQTTPTDPSKFAFFATLSSRADAQGLLYANVTGGLPEGSYRMSSMNTAMNHQPLLVPVVQRGASDDTIYFSVISSGNNGTSNTTTFTLPSTMPSQTPSGTPLASTPTMTTSTPVTPIPTSSEDDTGCGEETTTPAPVQPTPATPLPTPSGTDDTDCQT